MAHDVFVSHSVKDKPTADAVCAVLESQGIRCWVAPRDIIPGRDWGESIVEAIKGARVMVLVFSTNANNSQQIKREVERAVNKGIPVIPLRIEDVAPTASLEYFLSTPHWLDAFTPPLENHLQYLAQIIRQIIGGSVVEVLPAPTAGQELRDKTPAAEPEPPVTTGEPAAAPAPPARKTAKMIWIAAGILVVFALLILGGYFGTKPPPPGPAQPQIQAGATAQTDTPADSTNVVTTLPPIPEEARKHFVRGTTLFKDAKTADEFSQVESEFKQAADLAPQWPEARYNLALAKEAAGDYSGAIDDWKLYQSFKLSDAEARTVQDKIYALDAKQQKKASDVARAQAEEAARKQAETERQAAAQAKAEAEQQAAAQAKAEADKQAEAQRAAQAKAEADWPGTTSPTRIIRIPSGLKAARNFDGSYQWTETIHPNDDIQIVPKSDWLFNWETTTSVSGDMQIAYEKPDGTYADPGPKDLLHPSSTHRFRVKPGRERDIPITFSAWRPSDLIPVP